MDDVMQDRSDRWCVTVRAGARSCLLALWLAGCAGTHHKPVDKAASPPAASAPAGMAAVPTAAPGPRSAASAPQAEPAARAASTAEQALAQGIKAYQSGQYPQAEAQLKQALKLGLTMPADTARAHKHLAFIYCTSQREGQCAAAFKAARAADPKFALSKSEAGHPMWSKVYRQALGLK